jgi:hypothetical protein
MARSPQQRIPAPLQPVVRELIRIYNQEQKKGIKEVEKSIVTAFLQRLEDTNNG